MSPTYQPSTLRGLRTHSNAGIVLGDTGRRGSDARYLRQIKKQTNNVSLPNAATGFRLRTAR